jgi:hypothetical protein
MPRDIRSLSEDEKENEIVNRHLAALVTELQKKGFKAEAVVGFVVFEGPENFNLATLLDARKLEIPTEQARVVLLEYAHDEICKRIDEMDEPAPPGAQRH